MIEPKALPVRDDQAAQAGDLERIYGQYFTPPQTPTPNYFEPPVALDYSTWAYSYATDSTVERRSVEKR